MGREPLGPPSPGGPPRADEPGGPAWPERVEDQIRNLKQLCAALGVLALLAAGLAVWALLADDEGEGGTVSQSRVARLDDRVDDLEKQVRNSSDESQTEELQKDLDAKADKEDLDTLQSEVEDLRQAVDDADSGDGAQQAVDQLGQRVDQLEQDVEDLQNQQQP
jgi:polyhydroxyalkanoate synthesis regulator phasin